MRIRSSKILSSLALVSLVVSAACAPKNSIDANAIAVPLKSVTARHDAYVKADTSLTDVEKSTFLRSSQILNDVTNAAVSPPG